MTTGSAYRGRACAPRRSLARWLTLGSVFSLGWALPSLAQSQLSAAGEVVPQNGAAASGDTANGDTANGKAARRCTATVVHLDVAAEVNGCPSAAEVAQWVNTLTGRKSVSAATAESDSCDAAGAGPAVSDGRFDIWVRVELAQPNAASVSPDFVPAPDHLDGSPSKHDVQAPELAAFIVALPLDSSPLRSSPAASSSALPVRTLVQRVACDELLRVAALSISLLVDSEPTPSHVNANPGPSNSNANILLQPNQGEPTSPGSEVPRQNDAPSASPPSPVSPERRVSDIATSGPRLEDDDPYPVFGVRGHVGLGLNPAVNGGAAASMGLGVQQWWLQAYASFSTSVKRAPARESGLTGYVRATTWTFGIEPCLTLVDTLGVCVDAGYNALDAQGSGFDVDRSEVVHFWSAGASGTYFWPLFGSLRGSVGLGLAVPLTRVTMSVSGVSEPIWQMPPLSGRVSAGIDWR